MAAETGQGRAEASLSAVERWWEAGQVSGGTTAATRTDPWGEPGTGPAAGPGPEGGLTGPCWPRRWRPPLPRRPWRPRGSIRA